MNKLISQQIVIVLSFCLSVKLCSQKDYFSKGRVCSTSIPLYDKFLSAFKYYFEILLSLNVVVYGHPRLLFLEKRKDSFSFMILIARHFCYEQSYFRCIKFNNVSHVLPTFVSVLLERKFSSR